MRQTKKSPRRKTRAELDAEGRERQRAKKHRGHTAGSRSNISGQMAKSAGSSNIKDPRIGSKKPIDLIVDPTTSLKPERNITLVANREKLTPEQELAQLESDEKLDALLERLENGEVLTSEGLRYVDEKLDRIDELMALLGIELNDDEDEDDFQTGQSDIVRLLKQKD